MDQFTEVISLLVRFLPALVALAIVVLGLWGADRFLLRRKRDLTEGERLGRQALMLALTAIGIVFVLLALPVGDTTRNQLLGILGLILSGVIAFSSTTFVSNVMAGLMLRSVNSFRSGDFIRVGEQFGRVTERGLFHAEIQTEDRDLTTIPNIYLITHPVTVVHSSGTIVSANVSLGYEVPRQQIEATLIEAAVQADLQDPFVQVLDLGDCSVTYRIAGFLLEAKQLLSVRSTLRKKMLDALHAADIEIVSPTFMNQRQLGQMDRVMPEVAPLPEAELPGEAGKAPESMMFEKAEEAEKLEQMREERKKLNQEIEELRAKSGKAESEEQDDLDSQIRALELRARWLDTMLEKSENQKENGGGRVGGRRFRKVRNNTRDTPGRLEPMRSIFAMAAVLTLVATANSARAVMWDTDEVTDPISGSEITVERQISGGGYIYDYDSKYDAVYLPCTAEMGIWFNPESGYVAFHGDFEELTDKEIEKVKGMLAKEYTKGPEPLTMEGKLELLEKVYKQRDTVESFWPWFYRIKAHWYDQLDHPELALEARKQAVPLIEEQIKDLEPGEYFIQLHYVLGDYSRQLGKPEKAREYFQKARSIKWTDEEGNEQVGSEYINEIILEREKLIED